MKGIKSDQINYCALVLHALAFGLYILSALVFCVFYTLFFLNKNNS